ncbi:hypothetical protein GFM02_24480 [Rhizobium leguminosarum bv. viciae]|uniref:hypothetical protein n=1 Tax=Rhizobium leguminosarum TaxID=384 RepID=UPI0014424283|nr:hypothetical protein [Rhizobium leguminosarum bv. viciae]
MSARQGLGKPFRIGTRASPPAIAQASEVAARLCACHGLPAESFVIVPLTTKGDRLSEQPLPDIGSIVTPCRERSCRSAGSTPPPCARWRPFSLAG